MTRKFIALTLAFLLALSLTACGGTGNAANGSGQNSGGNRTGANTGNSSAQSPDTGNQTAAPGGAGADGDTIPKEQAQAIALEHAGLTADQVTDLYVTYDVDDGVPEYEVEFRYDRWEYEYEIHAQTGDIRSYDRDD